MIPKIKIIYRKLGKEQAYGIASSDGIIEIDSRLKSKKHFLADTAPNRRCKTVLRLSQTIPLVVVPTPAKANRKTPTA